MKAKQWAHGITTEAQQPIIFGAGSKDAIVLAGLLLGGVTPYHLNALCSQTGKNRGIKYDWAAQLAADHYRRKGYACESVDIVLPLSAFEGLPEICRPTHADKEGNVHTVAAQLVPAPGHARGKFDNVPLWRAIVNAQIAAYGIAHVNTLYSVKQCETLAIDGLTGYAMPTAPQAASEAPASDEQRARAESGADDGANAIERDALVSDVMAAEQAVASATNAKTRRKATTAMKAAQKALADFDAAHAEEANK